MAQNDFKLLSDLVSASDDFRVGVSSEGGKERIFVFDRLDTSTYKRYQDILVGRGGRRKGDAWKASYFLFERKLKDVEGLTDEEKAWLESQDKTVKEIMLADNSYGVLIDMVIGRYLNMVLPDAEELKSSSAGG